MKAAQSDSGNTLTRVSQGAIDLELLARSLEGVAVVVDRVSSGKQFARFREENHDTAHHQSRGRDIDVPWGDSLMVLPQLINYFAGTVN
jgi:hypothetical protein